MQDTNSIQTRKRDLVIRIADWTKDKDEPAFDVEVYVKGSYDPEYSKTFCTRNANKTKKQARQAAIAFAQETIASLL